MSQPCGCAQPHAHRQIVLTGGPGAGKTAVLELVRQHFCEHVRVLPEAAGIVFGGGFPRGGADVAVRAAQRAIFYVQRELERAVEGTNAAIVLCDRGTIDGAAYWPGGGQLWDDVGSTLDEQLRRYDAVIHLRTPALSAGYNLQNPLRIESPAEALAVDQRLLEIWAQHPRRFVVEAERDFLAKAGRVLDVLRTELPECCRNHRAPRLDGAGAHKAVSA